MALSYLVDTSVLTRLRDTAVREALERPAVMSATGRCSMTDLELGFSARDAAEWDAIHDAVAAFALVDVLGEDLRRALHVQRQLAGAGLRGRKVPDLLIAAAAERTGRTVLHYDRDFEHIAKVTGQPHEWIVPAGSVD